MSYIKDSFLLTTKSAQRLYFEYAKDMPIFDYHCHLPEKQLLLDEPFNDIFEIWLAGDHYKWRLMRNYGIDEEYITGSASNKEKFIKYCSVLGTAFGNPLYHWSQVELKEFFNCELEINEGNAEAIWEMCNKYIAENKITPSKLIKQSNVKYIFTTNEVFDDLTAFTELKKQDRGYTVLPAFRADKIMNIDAERYLEFLSALEGQTHKINGIDDLEDCLEIRLEEFIKVGCRASDIALEGVYPLSARADADLVLKKVISGVSPDSDEVKCFKSYLTYFLMKLYAKHGIATELHIGAMRNNNSVMLERLGLDTGYDSISEETGITDLSRLLDKLNSEGSLPKLILFNLNPKMNLELMTLLGCFQDGSAKGKIQYGPAWWFLDNKDGMEKHLHDMTSVGHLATFIGMLTDSRSLLSYPRHHYFRRILCSYLGEMIEDGLMTCDMALVGNVVRDICYGNAIKYFSL